MGGKEKESELFSVQVSLKQGSVMSTWRVNIFMNRVMKKLNERVKGRGAALRSNSFEVNQLLLADDMALVA